MIFATENSFSTWEKMKDINIFVGNKMSGNIVYSDVQQLKGLYQPNFLFFFCLVAILIAWLKEGPNETSCL